MPNVLSWIVDGPIERRYAASLALNLMLVLIVLSGRFVQLSWDKDGFALKPASRDLRSQVEVLFKDASSRPELRTLLREKRFFEVSNDTDDVASVTAALSELKKDSAIERELRQLARDQEGPFAPMPLTLSIDFLDETIVHGNEAAFCSKTDLANRYLRIWRADNLSAILVRAVHAKPCAPGHAERVYISREFADSFLSPGSGQPAAVTAGVPVHALVEVYLHEPPEPELPVQQTQSGQSS